MGKDELEAAESALQHYDAAVSQRDYKQALSLAMAARDTAYEAVKRAADEKAAARGRAERLIAIAGQAVTEVDAALSRLGTGRAQAPLVARLQAILRRTGAASIDPTLRCSDLVVDINE